MLSRPPANPTATHAAPRGPRRALENEAGQKHTKGCLPVRLPHTPLQQSVFLLQ